MPTLNKKLFFLNFLSFFRNKKIIQNIFKSSRRLNICIVTAEYPVARKLLRLLGVSYNPEKYPHKKALMMYSSFIKNREARQNIRNSVAEQNKKCKLIAGLGTIAVGIFGNEPILSPAELDEDLAFLRNNKIENAVIFRLAGLNEEYIKVIKNYAR